MPTWMIVILVIIGYFIIALSTIFIYTYVSNKLDIDDPFNTEDLICIGIFWPITLVYLILMTPISLAYGIVALGEKAADRRRKEDKYEEDEQYNSDWS